LLRANRICLYRTLSSSSFLFRSVWWKVLHRVYACSCIICFIDKEKERKHKKLMCIEMYIRWFLCSNRMINKCEKKNERTKRKLFDNNLLVKMGYMNFGPRNFRPGLSARPKFFLTIKLEHPHPHIHFVPGRKSGPKIPWAEIPVSRKDETFFFHLSFN